MTYIVYHRVCPMGYPQLFSDNVALQDAGVTLVNGTDYDLEYQNIEVGTATIIVKFKGNYEGERSVNFEIVARTLSNQDVSFAAIDTQKYTGETITPEPAITYNGVTLEKDKDYTLSYADNIDVGTATEIFVYGSEKQRDATPEEIKEIKLCFDYLKEKNLVSSIGKNEYKLDTNLEIEEDDDEEMEM